MFSTSNFRFLRVSKTTVISLNLTLAKEDLDWFNDYSLQEVLSILKPLLVARIDLYNRGHVTRLPSATSVNDPDEGLDDVGVVLGGDAQEENKGTGGSSKSLRRTQTTKRPRFSIWYGFRDGSLSERGTAILVSNKRLGFLSKVKEEAKEDALDKVAILQEENEDLRVSDYALGEGDVDGNVNDNDGGDSDEYQDPVDASKRSRRSTGAKGKGSASKRSKADEASSSATVDHKPTLNVTYSPMRLLPHTLHIEIRTVGASTGERVTGGEEPEDEASLFPPNLDFFS
ncbi:hypothetical protein BGZ94_005654 [Podila epigama]|nr:hypothetical protein BGZ94_005654 [Podila epigama]